MTSKQEELALKHGTPEQFKKALNKVLGEITLDEANRAIQKYQDEWNEAGGQVYDCYAIIDPQSGKPICVAKELDELSACLEQRRINDTEYIKRRLYQVKGHFTVENKA